MKNMYQVANSLMLTASALHGKNIKLLMNIHSYSFLTKHWLIKNSELLAS